jgi:hypothetical protein
MSFRFADLKKTVRKTKEGLQVTPARLEGRAPAFRIEFLLQQFEGHLGCPRRMLDPDALLDFVGDARLGRGLLATLAQWYRMRPRTFAEVLADGGVGLQEHGIAGPIDLRAWLYTAVNRGSGYLDPAAEGVFWQGQARALGVRREALQKLMLLDRPEEAVLVRTGPAPTAADGMAAYNARAHTTLLRSAARVTLRCGGPRAAMERAARAWAGPLAIEWRVEGDRLRLDGHADALGCWTRHGRRVERAALELLSLPELAVQELQGQLEIGDRSCRFVWKQDALSMLGAGSGAPLSEALPLLIDTLAAALRREREGAGEWGIRRASHLIGVAGGVFLPHLELRRGDLTLFLRCTGPALEPTPAAQLSSFRGKTPVALVAGTAAEGEALTLQLAGRGPEICPPGTLLATLAARLDPLRAVLAAAPGASEQRPLKRAA